VAAGISGGVGDPLLDAIAVVVAIGFAKATSDGVVDGDAAVAHALLVGKLRR
jgi:hypothetical protein